MKVDVNFTAPVWSSGVGQSLDAVRNVFARAEGMGDMLEHAIDVREWP